METLITVIFITFFILLISILVYLIYEHLKFKKLDLSSKEEVRKLVWSYNLLGYMLKTSKDPPTYKFIYKDTRQNKND